MTGLARFTAETTNIYLIQLILIGEKANRRGVQRQFARAPRANLNVVKMIILMIAISLQVQYVVSTMEHGLARRPTEPMLSVPSWTIAVLIEEHLFT